MLSLSHLIALLVGVLVGLLIDALRERKQDTDSVKVDLHTFEAMIDALTRSKVYVLDCVRSRQPGRSDSEKVLKALAIALGEGNGHAPQAAKSKRPATFF